MCAALLFKVFLLTELGMEFFGTFHFLNDIKLVELLRLF